MAWRLVAGAHAGMPAPHPAPWPERAARPCVGHPPHAQVLADPVTHELTVAKRLMAGACAGMTASALTHPLDTARLRLALPNHPYKGEQACRQRRRLLGAAARSLFVCGAGTGTTRGGCVGRERRWQAGRRPGKAGGLQHPLPRPHKQLQRKPLELEAASPCHPELAQPLTPHACSPPRPLHTPTSAPGAIDAFSTVVRTEGVAALYKGLVPTLVSSLGRLPCQCRGSRPFTGVCGNSADWLSRLCRA